MKYDHDYVVFDEFGLAKLLCQCCGTVIGERTYVPVTSKQDPSKTIQAAVFARNSSYSPVEVTLSDGSYTRAQLCKGCAKEDIDKTKCMAQFARAAEQENELAGGKDQPNAKAHVNKFKVLTMLGKSKKEK